MKTIKDEATLRKYIPNAIATVKGETPLFDKLAPFLQNAELWVEQHITSATVLSAIMDNEEDESSLVLCRQMVVAGAMMDAIPSLDVVLTPNGFGIVSNSNIAPASKERVRSLIDSMETIRDNTIEALLPFLMKREDWRDTEQGHFFQGTLFPNIDLTTLCGYSSHRWKQYLGLRHRTQQLEEQLAAEYISSEQLDVLHEMNLKGSASTIQKRIIDNLRQVIVALLTENNAYAARHAPHRALPDIVQVMRSHPEEFPQWHSSHVAKLFSPPIFENKKDNKGYWF
jgi:hypothetical protein